MLKNELFDGIAHLMLKAPTFNEQLSKLRVGLFLKEILDRATSIKDDQNSMYMYSAHGKTMANLLHTLNMLPVSLNQPLVSPNVKSLPNHSA